MVKSINQLPLVSFDIFIEVLCRTQVSRLLSPQEQNAKTAPELRHIFGRGVSFSAYFAFVIYEHRAHASIRLSFKNPLTTYSTITSLDTQSANERICVKITKKRSPLAARSSVSRKHKQRLKSSSRFASNNDASATDWQH